MFAASRLHQLRADLASLVSAKFENSALGYLGLHELADNAVGVVTAGTGAAIRDILQVLGPRFPTLLVVVYAVPVQGDGAG